MLKQWRFNLNPIAASRPRVTRMGHTYYAGPYKKFRENMIPIKEEQLGDLEPSTALLLVEIECYITKPKTTKLITPRADVDNYAKAILDTFNGWLWEDDRQIISLVISKAWCEDEGNEGYYTISIEEVLNNE